MSNLSFLRNLILILCINIFVFLISLHAENSSDKIINYNGIPGCTCFLHCNCNCCFTYSCRHYSCRDPDLPQNILWHTYIQRLEEAKRVGPYFTGEICANVNYTWPHDCSMLSEYLQGINNVRNKLEEKANHYIKWFKTKVYTHPSEANKLEKEVSEIKKEMDDASAVLTKLSAEIIPLYNNILSSCPHKSASNLALSYNEGLYCLLHGDFEGSLEKINELVLFAETGNSKDKLLNSKIYQQQGESLLEVGLYHEAILALTNSIEKDPNNKEAYFSRASANFEIGNFDLAIKDFKVSEVRAKNLDPKASNDFSSALISGILTGGKDAAVEFIPSLCNTASGLGRCLWCFANAPIESSKNFCNACAEMGEATAEYIKNLDQEAILGLADEVKQLYKKFDDLNESEKGTAIGYCLGKYGTNFFAGATTVKCFQATQKLIRANRLANLEALTASESSREVVKTAAMVHAAEREAFLKNVKIHWDRQNKHIPGKHNYELGKSVFDHKNPQQLLERYAGKGTPVNNKSFGMTGYRERVDFGEHIGFYIPENDPTIKLRTTRGIIHYSKDGVHIVPANPVGA